ncbi:MAG TPA: MnhB domain-containing protein [Steroidobacteraceae bacterium]|jgi:multicomponent Na+:H+ antiporter subunit B|nr:MnhB domain-containing protein [Steroidobacteraceae bacterium]
MSPRWRLLLLTLALLALAPGLWRVARAMPPFGSPTSLYGPAINQLAPAARHVSNMVAAVNFDFRGFDTLGEETMLLCAVTGAVVLLRGSRGEGGRDRAGRLPGRTVAPRADATVLVCRLSAALVLLFGVYVVLHGTVTPGGGFQGGVIAASSFLLLYLGEGYDVWRRLMRGPLLQLLEAGGALAFVVAAAVPLIRAHPALTNLLPLGQFRSLYSGGLVLVVNDAVGLSVTGSFGMLLLEFLEETRSSASDPVPDEEDT